MSDVSTLRGARNHHQREVEEIRADRELAVAYARAAMELFDEPKDRAGALLALRAISEAYGGLTNLSVDGALVRPP